MSESGLRCSEPALILEGVLVHLLSPSPGPAEQRGHLLIRHGLLLSHSHSLAQVDGQDVFALGDKSADSSHGHRKQNDNSHGYEAIM